ncbi:hypothetical protein LX36DRAFT_6758 [Colletotrichum falcatum]|nr:hypothetical protein LX36DRAFT_6758 [Colletotrichum falcatum]
MCVVRGIYPAHTRESVVPRRMAADCICGWLTTLAACRLPACLGQDTLACRYVSICEQDDFKHVVFVWYIFALGSFHIFVSI